MIFCTNKLICEEIQCPYYHGVKEDHLVDTFSINWNVNSDTAVEWRRNKNRLIKQYLTRGWHITCYFRQKLDTSPVHGYLINFIDYPNKKSVEIYNSKCTLSLEAYRRRNG